MFYKRININLDEKRYKDLKKALIDRNKTISNFIREKIDELIQEELNVSK